MERVAFLEEGLDLCLRPDFEEKESLIRDHRNAMVCWDLEDSARFSLYVFQDLYSIANRITAEGSDDPLGVSQLKPLLLKLKGVFEGVLKSAPECKKRGHPIERAERVAWALERILPLCESLEGARSEKDYRECLEDFVDLVDSDVIASDPNSEFIPWSRTTRAA